MLSHQKIMLLKWLVHWEEQIKYFFPWEYLAVELAIHPLNIPVRICEQIQKNHNRFEERDHYVILIHQLLGLTHLQVIQNYYKLIYSTSLVHLLKNLFFQIQL